MLSKFPPPSIHQRAKKVFSEKVDHCCGQKSPKSTRCGWISDETFTLSTLRLTWRIPKETELVNFGLIRISLFPEFHFCISRSWCKSSGWSILNFNTKTLHRICKYVFLALSAHAFPKFIIFDSIIRVLWNCMMKRIVKFVTGVFNTQQYRIYNTFNRITLC